MADEITKGIIDKADGVLVEVYKDAISPIAKPVGEILGFLPRTLKLALSGWEKWLINGEETIRLTAESVREKIQALPEEKLVEPEPYVAIPAMQQLSYCVNNEELRELYANLLVSSMNVDKKWQVHPAFVDIIKQLTPDEQNNVPVSSFVLNIGEREEMLLRVVVKRAALDEVVSTISKDDRVLVEGRLQITTVKSDTGAERRIFEIDANTIEMMGAGAPVVASVSTSSNADIVKFSNEEFADELIGEDEIPF